MRTAEIRGVDVLTARARGSIGVDPAIGFIHLDVDLVVDHGIDPDRGEARMPPRVRIEGRDAHEAVNAQFGLQPAIGVLALDLQRGALDARFLAIGDVDDLDLAFAALGPARVHAHQHIGPILALGAAGARMDLEIGVVAVRLAGEERLDLLALSTMHDGGDSLLTLDDRSFIALPFAELDKHAGIIELALERRDGLEARVEVGALAHHLLRFCGIVPKRAGFGERVQLGETLLRFIPVKDASSAVRWTAWRLRADSRSRHA